MEITEVLDSGNIINIKTIIGSVVTKVNNQGTDDEYKSFAFSGIVKNNKPIKIGTISISTPDSSKRFYKSPSINPKIINRKLGLGSYLKTKVTSTTKDSNGNITSYLFDLIYVGKEKVSKSETLKYKIVDPVSTIKTREEGVNRIICGNYLLSSAGEKRKITLQGKPGSEFEIAINKLIDAKDSLDNITSTSDSSILLNPNSTGGESGVERTFKDKINANGTYSFYQSFPRNVITSNENSPQRYSIDLKTSSVTSRFSTNGLLINRANWQGWYSKILEQHINPTITLRPTTNLTSNTTISVNSGTAVNFTSVTPTAYDLKYTGYYGRAKRGNVEKSYSISYAMVNSVGTWAAKSGPGGSVSFNSLGPNDFGATFSTRNILGTPVFSATDQSESDWTFSVPENNGGTVIDITNITVAGLGTNTLTLTFDFKIHKWGYKDITMNLAMNSIAQPD